MVRSPSQQPQRPVLTLDQKLKVIGRLQKRIMELEDFDPSSVLKRFGSPEVAALEAAISETLAAAFGQGTAEYRRYSRAADLDQGPISVITSFNQGRRPEDNPSVFQGYFQQGKDEAIALLKQAVRGLEEEIESLDSSAGAPAVLLPRLQSNRVFVVHGHDDAALQRLARFLEKLGLIATVLREQPDQGRTIIEKFEDFARDVGFAVVLLTPDDVGGSASATQPEARARQNVVFELGFFAGQAG
jgi:hypothetical protein